MFSGVFQYSMWMAAVAGLSVILAACYTLNMIRKVFYGDTNMNTENIRDLNISETIGLSLIVIMVFLLGVFPQPVIDLTKSAVEGLIGK